MARPTTPSDRAVGKNSGKMETMEIRTLPAYVTSHPLRTLARMQRRRPVRASRFLLAALLGACAITTEPSVTPPPGASTTAPATTVAPPSTSTTVPLASGCPEGDVMLTEGQLLSWERPTADAARVAGIGWRLVGNCQAVTVSFATDDGAPATTPPTLTARLLRSEGVLRIDTAATASVVSDQLVEEGLVERIFVPVDADGNRFVDLVLTGPVVVRARLLTSPARLEIELQPGGPTDVGRPLVTDDLVLVEPGIGAQVEPVIDVDGYSLGLTEELTVAALRGGAPIFETTLPLAADTDVWTAFGGPLQVGDQPYDRVQIERPDGSVLAGIPVRP